MRNNLEALIRNRLHNFNRQLHDTHLLSIIQGQVDGEALPRFIILIERHFSDFPLGFLSIRVDRITEDGKIETIYQYYDLSVNRGISIKGLRESTEQGIIGVPVKGLDVVRYISNALKEECPDCRWQRLSDSSRNILKLMTGVLLDDIKYEIQEFIKNLLVQEKKELENIEEVIKEIEKWYDIYQDREELGINIKLFYPGSQNCGVILIRALKGVYKTLSSFSVRYLYNGLDESKEIEDVTIIQSSLFDMLLNTYVYTKFAAQDPRINTRKHKYTERDFYILITNLIENFHEKCHEKQNKMLEDSDNIPSLRRI